MTVFARQIATAKRVVSAKGELCDWHKPRADTTVDPDHPWKPEHAEDAPTPVRIVWEFKDIRSIASAMFATGREMPAGTKFGLMADNGFAPTIGDYVVRADASVWRVFSADAVDPDGAPILWALRLEQ